MIFNKTKTTTAYICAIAVSALVGTLPASATQGSFALGYGASQRATGGAGVAQSTDALSAAINPALAIGVGRELQMGVEFFSPLRGYTATGTGFVAGGEVRSGSNLFFIPNIAYNKPLDDGSALNFSLYGNGGMNTTFGNVASKCGPGAPGVFCGGPAGVDLIQAFASIGYARRDGNIRWGISPVLAIQAFEAKGLGAFAPSSSNPAALTDNGYDFSFGGGIRGGIVIDITNQLRFAVSGQSKMWMTRLDKYAGLFEGAGSFDIPASVTAGFAYDATPDLTFMADYHHIFYSGVKAISNPFKPALLGSNDGPGFGWDDVHTLKFGMEWRESEQMTWRAGYAVASNPVGSDDVTLGILAPGIVEHHITGGGAYKLNERDSIDFALVYAFSNTVNGIEVTPSGPIFASNIELEMHQFSATIGWKRSY